MSTLIRLATTAEVIDSSPSSVGRKMKRRNDSPPIPMRTATAHTATKAAYQLVAGSA